MSTTVNHTITLKRENRGKGDLTATTVIELGRDRRVLEISTSKNAFRPGISCVVRGKRVSECGRSLEYAAGVAGRGDFTRKVKEADCRATEKALTQLHMQALAELDSLMPEVKTYYGLN